ncbi:MAG: DUF1292 domain-containing protein [Saccharofermentanales bacterium]|jgi:hypothetical protein|nr:DUF1292 domain-containing protein [Bacillota bacterium]NLB08412.1 DUF1292 domain-containing protein [Clostridiales bacterium]
MLSTKNIYYAAADEEGFEPGLGDELFADEGAIVVMEDTETGEEYFFEMVDQFEFEDKVYCVLVTTTDDDEEDDYGEWVITQIVEDPESGEVSLVSLDDDENDRVYEEYDRLLDEYAEAEEDYEEDESYEADDQD